MLSTGWRWLSGSRLKKAEEHREDMVARSYNWEVEANICWIMTRDVKQ